MVRNILCSEKVVKDVGLAFMEENPADPFVLSSGKLPVEIHGFTPL